MTKEHKETQWYINFAAFKFIQIRSWEHDSQKEIRSWEHITLDNWNNQSLAPPYD